LLGPELSDQVFQTPEDGSQKVGTWLADRANEGVMPHEMGVFIRSPAELDRARAAVEHAGLPFTVLDEHVDTTSGRVSISTMHLAKGMEFRAIAVMGYGEVIPLQVRIKTVADDADLEEGYNTERYLLYVACTRTAGSSARDERRPAIGVPRWSADVRIRKAVRGSRAPIPVKQYEGTHTRPRMNEGGIDGISQPTARAVGRGSTL
jgi:hypothetical protein